MVIDIEKMWRQYKNIMGGSRDRKHYIQEQKAPIIVKMHMAWASLIAQLEEDQPAMQETQVQFLGQKDPLEKEMAIHSSNLICKVPWTEKPGGLHSPWGCKSWTWLSD